MKEPFCKNCILYDFKKRHCTVIVLHEGQRLNPPTEPNDACIFENEYKSIHNGEIDVWKPELKELKMFEDNGKVKIQYNE